MLKSHEETQSLSETQNLIRLDCIICSQAIELAMAVSQSHNYAHIFLRLYQFHSYLCQS